ncbi:MAG: hypothetical protein IT445_16145 [Phycisphaeraceae bacterium]|nr:hypothetical protein [Phycisphaeraceae bacterium]
MIRLSSLVGIALIVPMVLLGCERTSTAPSPAPPEASQALAAETAAETSNAQAVPDDIAELSKLEDVMKQIGRSFKFLRTHIADAASDGQSLEHARRIRLLAAKAGGMTPELVSRAPEAEQAAKMATFHEKFAALPPLVDELIAALEAGDRDAAQKALTDMHEAEEAGHEAMGVEDH